MDARELARKIKEKLVALAASDSLPLDMNLLDVDVIEDVINENATLETPETRAGSYLCDSEEFTIEEQIELIRDHPEGSDFIDNVDGVLVWAKLENSITCDEFFNLIED